MMKFWILGTRLTAQADSGTNIELTRPQVRHLVCVLALEAERAVATETLIDLLWDPGESRDPMRSLKQAVYKARQALPANRLSTELGAYRLLVAPEDYLDLTDFRRLVERASAHLDAEPNTAIAALQSALDLWGEPPLGDLPATTAMEPVRQALLAERCEAREKLAELHLRLEHHRQIVPRLRRWLGDDPLNERLRGLLMLALYRSDRKGQSLQEFAEAEAALGTAPGIWLQELADRIKRNDPELKGSNLVPRLSPPILEERMVNPAQIDTTIASPARIYDYFLNGKDNYAVDRAAAEEIMKAVPESPIAAHANRAFLARAVRFMAEEAGIRQFIDIGTGLPTQGNVHEVAQEAASDAHVVYVDHDPVVLAHGRALLETSAGVAVIEGDLRRPDEILADARLRELIDFQKPIGLLMVGVLHFIDDADEPFSHVERLSGALPPGSYLVVSHGYDGGMKTGSSEAAQRVYQRSSSAIHSRDPAQVARFFRGLELLDPGVVWVPEWRPGRKAEVDDPSITHFIGAVGYKPPPFSR